YWIPGYRAKNKANSPVPMNQSTTARPDADLMFLAARNAISNRVYLGTDPAGLNLLADDVDNAENIIDPGSLIDNTTYYWRVDTVLADSSVVAGDVWHFTVEQPLVETQQVITVREDVDVRSDQPDANREGETTLAVRTPTDGTAEKIAYLKFDVDVSGVISRATLRLHRSGTSNIRDVEIYAMSDTSWDPTTMTWNTRPTIDGPLLALSDIGGGLWADFDVTNALSNGTIAFGIRRATSDSNRSFDSLESAFAPELEIIFSEGSLTPSVPALHDTMTVLLVVLLLGLGGRRARYSSTAC
ncbi:MAG: DNRLRE domain-containing protein, partial [Myxococcota bacterium]